MNHKFIAHTKKSNGVQQSLKEHLTEVSEIAGNLSSKIGMFRAGALIGLLHDLGKYSGAFQKYIQSATGVINPDEDDYVQFKEMKGKIDHSTAGAQLVWKMHSPLATKTGQGELCGQILALCIASHHSGMIDCFDKNDEPVFSRRMQKMEDKVHLQECHSAADKEILAAIDQLSGIS